MFISKTMKLFEGRHDFNYPWHQVTAANWQKYPNEFSTHVVSVDTLNREIDSERQVLRTERLIGCKQPIPKWISTLVGGMEWSFVREISEVDLVKKTLIMKSTNLTMNHLLMVNETVIYKPDDELPNSRTNFIQDAEITAYSSFRKVCDKVEDWSVERFGQNAKTGKMAFENVLHTLTQKWDESGVFVSDMSNSIMKDINNVTRQGVLAEVSKLGNVFKD